MAKVATLKTKFFNQSRMSSGINSKSIAVGKIFTTPVMKIFRNISKKNLTINKEVFISPY